MNQCDNCGQFKRWEDLHTYGADDGSTPVVGLECTDCLSDFDRERLGLDKEEQKNDQY